MTHQQRIMAGSAIQKVGPEPDTGNPLIRRLQRLVNLTAADIAALEEISSKTFVLGSQVDLIHEDEISKDALIVLEGFACRYRRRLTGQRQIIAYLLPGDLCDVDAAPQGRMDHAVGTLSACRVARVSGEPRSGAHAQPS